MNESSTQTYKKGKATLLSDAAEFMWHKTTVKMYGVSDAQLRELTAGYNSLHLVFFGICLGGFISLLIAYCETADNTAKPYYFAAWLACLIGSVGFGYAGISNYRKASGERERLVSESVPITGPSK